MNFEKVLNTEAVELVIYTGIKKGKGTKEPNFPNPIPIEILSCLYIDGASHYDYTETNCKTKLIVKKEVITNLKQYFDEWGIPYETEAEYFEVKEVL